MAEKTMMEVLRAECPGAADALGAFFAALVAQPALDEKTKQLVYVAAAAAAGHVRGVPAHVARLRALGATRRARGALDDAARGRLRPALAVPAGGDGGLRRLAS